RRSRRGAVFVLSSPAGSPGPIQPGVSFVRRVIGLPGDRVTCCTAGVIRTLIRRKRRRRSLRSPEPALSLQTLDDRGGGHGAAGAHGDKGGARAAALEFVQRGGE